MTEKLITDLRSVVGDAHVLVDDDLRAPYETDWTRRFHGAAACVVRPASTREVAGVVDICRAAGAPMVVQGGNTGLVGGGVPAGGEVLVSLSRLTRVEPVDAIAGQVTVDAGVTLEKLQAHARAAGLDFGVDLAARSAATVGGLIATNAGGIRVLRYGSMRAQVCGVEAVMADGTVVSRLTGLAKDNTGYDLTQLLAGSEGTLAIITRARLRLVPLLPSRAVALVGVAGTDEALLLLAAARAGLPDLSAAEIFYADGAGPGAGAREPARAVRRRVPGVRDAGVHRPRRSDRRGTGDARRLRRRGRRHGRLRRGRGREAVGVPGEPHRGDQRRRRTGEAGRLRPAR